jgi:hypothetical protein
MSHAAVFEMPVAAPRGAPRVRRRAPANVLVASLAAAVVTTGLSVAAIDYAFTHIPEVDPNAEAAPVAAVAAIAAQASTEPAKLAVLTPPVYGPDVVNEAPAVPFVPLKAQTTAQTVDMTLLAQADGVTQPCGDPCAARADYIAPDGAAETPPATVADDREIVRPEIVRPMDRDADQRVDRGIDSGDDDGNAPPPPDMTVN